MPADVVTPRIEVAFARRATPLNRGARFDDIPQPGDIHHELFFTVGARHIIFLRNILFGNKHFRAVDRIAQIDTSPAEQIINTGDTQIGGGGFNYRGYLIGAHIREALHQYGGNAGNVRRSH